MNAFLFTPPGAHICTGHAGATWTPDCPGCKIEADELAHRRRQIEDALRKDKAFLIEAMRLYQARYDR